MISKRKTRIKRTKSQPSNPNPDLDMTNDSGEPSQLQELPDQTPPQQQQSPKIDPLMQNPNSDADVIITEEGDDVIQDGNGGEPIVGEAMGVLGSPILAGGGDGNVAVKKEEVVVSGGDDGDVAVVKKDDDDDVDLAADGGDVAVKEKVVVSSGYVAEVVLEKEERGNSTGVAGEGNENQNPALLIDDLLNLNPSVSEKDGSFLVNELNPSEQNPEMGMVGNSSEGGGEMSLDVGLEDGVGMGVERMSGLVDVNELVMEEENPDFVVADGFLENDGSGEFTKEMRVVDEMMGMQEEGGEGEGEVEVTSVEERCHLVEGLGGKVRGLGVDVNRVVWEEDGAGEVEMISIEERGPGLKGIDGQEGVEEVKINVVKQSQGVDVNIGVDGQERVEEVEVIGVEERGRGVKETEGVGMGMGMASSPPDVTVVSNIPDSPILDVSQNPTPSTQKKAKRKRRPNKMQKAALEKKMKSTRKNLVPVACMPKRMDLVKHEKVLKRLGLWDFAHVKYDQSVHKEFLVELIVNYSRNKYSSTVMDYRVHVNRTNLARALKLPLKKDKGHVETDEVDREVFSEEDIAFILEFVSSYMLLHDEDMWMTPNEILGYQKLIKEGSPDKVDWSSLVWFMVEKELDQATELTSCFYALHLQLLMRTQREELFKDLKVEVVSVDCEDDFNLKMDNLEDDLEKQQTELSLDQGNNDNQIIDNNELIVGQGYNNCQVNDDDDLLIDQGNNGSQVRDDNDFMVSNNNSQARDGNDLIDFPELNGEQWLLNRKGISSGFCLQRCNTDLVEDLGAQTLRKDIDGEEHYGISTENLMLERVASEDLFQGMDGKICSPFNQHNMNLQDEDFPHPGANTDMNLGEPSSMFGTSFKRERSPSGDDFPHSLNEQHKRMRNEGTWDHQSTGIIAHLDAIIGQAYKAKMEELKKEQSSADYSANLQILMGEVQKRDEMIANLNRIRVEEKQARDAEVYKYENELTLMSRCLKGYKKALKETRRLFDEYREDAPRPVEPLYIRVAGPGGNVISMREYKQQCLEKKEEDRVMRSVIKENFKAFELGWVNKLAELDNKVNMLGDRLHASTEEFCCIKEEYAKRKMFVAEVEE